MPFLSIVRRPAFVSRRLTQRFSVSTQKRRRCRFGRNRRLVLLFACETLWPTIGAFPVTWQTRAMARSSIRCRCRPPNPGESRKVEHYTAETHRDSIVYLQKSAGGG